MKKNIYEGQEQGPYQPARFIHMMRTELEFEMVEGTQLGEYQIWHTGDRCLVTYNSGPHPNSIDVVVQIEGEEPRLSEVEKLILEKTEDFENWWRIPTF